jgi:transposase
MRLVYLPPYSPDLNPIELAFSSIKSVLRAQSYEIQSMMTGRKGDQADVHIALHKAVYTVTPEKSQGWFRHCGYI